MLKNLILTFCAAITRLHMTSGRTHIPKSFTHNMAIQNENRKRESERGRLGHSRKGQWRASYHQSKQKKVSNKVKADGYFHLPICITDKASFMYVIRLPSGTTLHCSSFYFKKQDHN